MFFPLNNPLLAREGTAVKCINNDSTRQQSLSLTSTRGTGTVSGTPVPETGIKQLHLNT